MKPGRFLTTFKMTWRMRQFDYINVSVNYLLNMLKYQAKITLNARYLMNLNAKIIELCHPAGYILKGACHGLTIKWIEACLLGQTSQFDEQKKLILELDTESFGIAIQDIKEKAKVNNMYIVLSPKEHHFMTLVAFLKSTYLFQSLMGQNLLGFIGLRDIHQISAIASTDEIKQKGGLVNCELEAGNYSKTELAAWLERYETAIQDIDTPQNVFVFELSNEVHSIGVMYQKNAGTWQVEDSNNIQMTNFLSVSRQEIAEQIYMGLITSSMPDSPVHLRWIEFFRKKLQDKIKETPVNKKNKSFRLDYKKDSLEITVIYNAETEKWSPKDTNHILELEVMADYLALWFIGVKEPCPYINMSTIMYLTQDDEHSHNIIKKFQQKLLPYEPSTNWLQRANAFHLVSVASRIGNIDLVKKITEMHLYDDAALKEALFISAQENDIKIVNVLMTLPRSIRLINQIGDPTLNQIRRGDDSTPLMIAIQNDHADMVKLLLNMGANPNISNSFGVTPLAIAAHQGHLEIVNCLIEAHARLDQRKTDDGATALHFAVAGNHIAVVERLVQAGANIYIPTRSGLTPYQDAFARKYSVIVAFLAIEIGRNRPQLQNAFISYNVAPGFFGSKNNSGDPMELGIKRHLRGYFENTPGSICKPC
ncbi:MAG: hypothetical protein CK424_01385 [Legionella sp.]|nr:MAG: hypothetical protein CK424_01385 [Legionella sp.]